MRGGALLGLAVLAAFVAFCFSREPAPRGAREAPPGPRRRTGGDGHPRHADAGAYARRHIHEGNPSVRH